MSHVNAEAAHAANNAVIAAAQKAAAEHGVHCFIVVAAQHGDQLDGGKAATLIGAGGTRSVLGSKFGVEITTIGIVGMERLGWLAVGNECPDEESARAAREAWMAFVVDMYVRRWEEMTWKQVGELFDRNATGDGTPSAAETIRQSTEER